MRKRFFQFGIGLRILRTLQIVPTNRSTMRQIRESLQRQAGRSFTEVGRSLKIFRIAALKCVSWARPGGVDWTLAQTLCEKKLERRLCRPALPRCSYQLAPHIGQG